MEPLTGFFILEGLVFDIIGAYLIIRGLEKISIIDDPLFISATNRVNEKESHLERMIILRDNMRNTLVSKFPSHEIENTLQGRLSISDAEIHEIRKELETMKSNVISTITSLKIFRQHKQALARGLQGLPFLIGGFLLQGIGVINQLVN